jgi:hypothetical protein
MTNRNGNAPTKASETRETAPAPTGVCHKVNVFADSPEGFSTHIEVQFCEAGSIVRNLKVLTKALADAGFTARQQGAPSGPTCPEHGKAKKSQHGDGMYCPQKLNDGSYCKWRHEPGK